MKSNGQMEYDCYGNDCTTCRFYDYKGGICDECVDRNLSDNP